jgi:hypothetical protein
LKLTLQKPCEEARYVYCVAKSGQEKKFGPIGVEENQAYSVSFKDLAVVVHKCEAKPYETANKERAGEWILSHQYVIDLATEEFGTVVPLTFDTILKGDDEALKQWLSKEYTQLTDLLTRLENKAEYGVQIFLENDFADKLAENNNEGQNLKNCENASNGVAYLLQKKLEKQKQLERALAVEKLAKEICAQIKPLVENVRMGSINKEIPEKWRGKQMVLNASCLVHRDKVESLGSKLSQLKDDGYAVRFTGPWPPYSFAGQINEARN